MQTKTESINGITCITIFPDEGDTNGNMEFQILTRMEQKDPGMLASMAVDIDRFVPEFYKQYGIKRFTDYCMALNWKGFEHYEKGDRDLAEIYTDMWETANQWAYENLKDEELDYYFRTTD